MSRTYRIDQFKASTAFVKALGRLPKKDRDKVQSALRKASINLADSSLRCHKLKGPLAGVVSLDAGGDLRIHCRIHQEGQTIWAYLVAVGSHSQLYG